MNQPAQATRPDRADRRRIQVRRCGVHGKGVFALQPIAAGERVIEYTGEVISWKEALRRHPHDPADPHHTFYFHIDDEQVIDAKRRRQRGALDQPLLRRPTARPTRPTAASSSRRCATLHPGEELFYDYGLVIDERYTPKLKREYACRCGADGCRGTLLAPKR